MVSIVKKSKYKEADISLTYISDPTTIPDHPPHHHHHDPNHEDMTMITPTDEKELKIDTEKIPSFFFPPKMVIKFKDKEININEEFHAIKTYEGSYFTHYFPYRNFESPLDLSQAIVDSLIVEDEIKQIKIKEGGLSNE